MEHVFEELYFEGFKIHILSNNKRLLSQDNTKVRQFSSKILKK